MAEKAAPVLSIDAEFDEVKELSALANRIPTGSNLEFDSLPENDRSFVVDGVPDDMEDPLTCAIVDKHYITLCLSQEHALEPGSLWQFGCLSPEDQWGPCVDVKVDLQYLTKDYQCCLDFLYDEESAGSLIVIEKLLLQLDVTLKDFSSALSELECTLAKLRKHLTGLQYVVFEVTKSAFCCYSFKDVINNETGLPKAVDPQLALEQILGDLRACWSINGRIEPNLLVDYYFYKKVKPVSEMYLSKFVVSLSDPSIQDIVYDLNYDLNCSKLVPIYCLKSLDSVERLKEEMARRCRAILLDTADFGSYVLCDGLRPAFRFEDNISIERIVVTTHDYGLPIQLPQLNTPLTDTTLRSALIELVLDGWENVFDLALLNNGFFPNLAHLTFSGGIVTGHLDSRQLCSLKTLWIDPRYFIKFGHVRSLGELIQQQTQSLIGSGYPWQFITTQDPIGWSLASYEDPTTNPLEDEKSDSPQSPLDSLPLVRELMLVTDSRKHVNDWRLQPKGEESLEVDEDDKDHLFMRSLQRVQKITIFGTPGSGPNIKLTDSSMEILPNLTSMTCHNIHVSLEGAVFPHLQSLQVNFSILGLFGSFPELKTMTLEEIDFDNDWELNAPLLQTLICHRVDGDPLTIRPESTPHLSFVQMVTVESIRGEVLNFPRNEDCPGLSNVKHVVLGEEEECFHLFDHHRANDVLHLELTVNIWCLPDCWEKSIWRCEALKITVCDRGYLHFSNPDEGTLDTVLPSLPEVRELILTEDKCTVFLDKEMPKLTTCTVPSPRSLGENLLCPALERICFTDELSEDDRKLCLDSDTYTAIGARPSEIWFAVTNEVYFLEWGAIQDENEMPPVDAPLEEDTGSSKVRE